MTGLDPPDAVAPSGDAVTVYPVIADPLPLGAEKLTTARPSPDTADTPTGVPGTVTGTTPFDAPDGKPVPTLFVAVTLNV